MSEERNNIEEEVGDGQVYGLTPDEDEVLLEHEDEASLEYEDEVPLEYQRIAQDISEQLEEPLPDESEEDYVNRPLPNVPSAALLEALSVAWEYPIQGPAAYRGLLESFVSDPALSAHRDVFADLLDTLAEYDVPKETIVGSTALQLDYTRLFIGSFKMYAPPYASYYTDGENLIYGPTAANVENLYAQFGIEIDKSQHDMPDHIRFMLAFMSLLAKNYWKSGIRDFALAYEDFKEGFVDTWVSQFAQKIHEYSEYSYYKKLIDFTISVL